MRTRKLFMLAVLITLSACDRQPSDPGLFPQFSEAEEGQACIPYPCRELTGSEAEIIRDELMKTLVQGSGNCSMRAYHMLGMLSAGKIYANPHAPPGPTGEGNTDWLPDQNGVYRAQWVWIRPDVIGQVLPSCIWGSYTCGRMRAVLQHEG